MTIRLVVSLVATLALACSGSPKKTPDPTPSGEKVLVNVDGEGIGLGGHDPVAYATDNAAVAGVADQIASHGGAKYRFKTAETKKTFEGDTAKHAPQYGGYCAYAASMGRVSPSDPTVFQIYEGQLLVFTNADFKEQFNKDPAGNKKKADDNWPGLVAQHGK
jgi:hypothetical protein